MAKQGPFGGVGKPQPKGKVNNPVAYVSKGANAKSTRAIAVPDRMHASVSVRKISNGYVICESSDTPKGYTSTERFSPTKPKITMPSAMAPKTGK